MSRSREKSSLRLWTYLNGNEGVIGVEDFAENESFREMRALVAGPQDRREEVTLRQVGPRRYQATLPLWGKGRYHVLAEPVAQAEQKDRAFGGFIIPYSPEYLRFRSNPLVLDDLVKRTGGKTLELTAEMGAEDQSRQVFPPVEQRIPRRSSQPIDDWFLIALACLIPLDVGLRRVQIDPREVLRMLGFSTKDVRRGETMGALLERKREVGSLLSGGGSERQPLNTGSRRNPADPASVAGPESRPAGTPPPATPGRSPQSAPPAGDAESTTGRLLELKRRRQQNK
ncbi:MAG: hypothetical protein ACK50P_20225 [Planctomycetaceae bacterium]